MYVHTYTHFVVEIFYFLIISTFEILKFLNFILYSLSMCLSTITFIYGQVTFLEFKGYPECACRLNPHMVR